EASSTARAAVDATSIEAMWVGRVARSDCRLAVQSNSGAMGAGPVVSSLKLPHATMIAACALVTFAMAISSVAAKGRDVSVAIVWTLDPIATRGLVRAIRAIVVWSSRLLRLEL